MNLTQPPYLCLALVIIAARYLSFCWLLNLTGSQLVGLVAWVHDHSKRLYTHRKTRGEAMQISVSWAGFEHVIPEFEIAVTGRMLMKCNRNSDNNTRLVAGSGCVLERCWVLGAVLYALIQINPSKPSGYCHIGAQVPRGCTLQIFWLLSHLRFCLPCITVYQYSDRASQYISIVTVHHSISVQWNQRDAIFSIY
jgi:hypothetical protein